MALAAAAVAWFTLRTVAPHAEDEPAPERALVAAG
jgi:hypothetical protein